LAVPAALPALAACGDSVTQPAGGEPARTVALSGNGQAGLAGEELLRPVTVRVLDNHRGRYRARRFRGHRDGRSVRTYAGSATGAGTYGSSVGASQFAGYACPSGNIFMGGLSGAHPNLLAHEAGHTFTLVHSHGVMNPTAPGTFLSAGQIFRAHFDERSVLNTLFGSQPAALRRVCSDRPRDSTCLPEDFDLPLPEAGTR
jgi:hypothetical protein